MISVPLWMRLQFTWLALTARQFNAVVARRSSRTHKPFIFGVINYRLYDA
jgi:hypothetical protein